MERHGRDFFLYPNQPAKANFSALPTEMTPFSGHIKELTSLPLSIIEDKGLMKSSIVQGDIPR